MDIEDLIKKENKNRKRLEEKKRKAKIYRDKKKEERNELKKNNEQKDIIEKNDDIVKDEKETIKKNNDIVNDEKETTKETIKKNEEIIKKLIYKNNDNKNNFEEEFKEIEDDDKSIQSNKNDEDGMDILNKCYNERTNKAVGVVDKMKAISKPSFDVVFNSVCIVGNTLSNSIKKLYNYRGVGNTMNSNKEAYREPMTELIKEMNSNQLKMLGNPYVQCGLLVYGDAQQTKMENLLRDKGIKIDSKNPEDKLDMKLFKTALIQKLKEGDSKIEDKKEVKEPKIEDDIDENFMKELKKIEEQS